MEIHSNPVTITFNIDIQIEITLNITNNILQITNRKTTITYISDKINHKKYMYEKHSTRERRQQTYELIETVLRPECIVTLPQDFLCLNHRITFRGHTRGFGVNFLF